MGGSGAVAGPAANDEATIGAATCAYLADVVGGEVGGRVGGLLGPAGAPVAQQGAVVGDDATSALSLSGVVEVGASCSLGPVLVGLAVSAPGFAADGGAAADAGAQQGAAHRGLRLRRSRSLAAHLGQRSPGPTNRSLQTGQRPPRPWKRFCLFLRTAAEEGEEGGHAFGPGGCFPYSGDAGAGVGGDSDNGDVVEGGAGSGDALAVG
jgi:hypothetical protein